MDILVSPKSATLTPQIATAPTYGREPFAVATPPAATAPTNAARVVAGLLDRPRLADMCGQVQPGERRFCISDHGHTDEHRSGIWFSWPQLAVAVAGR